ncbi:MAG: hypothetical protein ACQEUZ_10905 [Pseudomonadota bacterium]
MSSPAFILSTALAAALFLPVAPAAAVSSGHPASADPNAPVILSLPLAGEEDAAPADPPPVLLSWPCLDAPGCGREGPDRVVLPDPRPAATPQPSPVPLPAALAALGLGLSALGLLMRRPGG